MRAQRSQENELIVGLVSISDRASRGEYMDEGLPALRAWCEDAILTPVQYHERLIPDDRYTIEETLRDLVDHLGCDLVFTTGGTGPSRRDVTPEATLAVATREMPGFAEQMRRISLNFVPTAILSRQVAVLREIPDHAALIVNLPGRPKAISETLGGFKSDDGEVIDAGIFASIPYCIDLIGGPYIETNPEIVAAFRPKSAIRPSSVATPEPVHEEPAEEPQHELQPEEHHEEPQAPAQTPTSTPRWATDVPSPVESYAATFGAAQTSFQANPDRKPSMSPEAIARRSVQHVQVSQPRTGVPVFGMQGKSGPEPLELFIKDPENGIAPRCTVIWLHGLGTDAHDFETLPQQLADFGAPAARFIFPNAPKRALSIQPDYKTRAWYDILCEDFVSKEDTVGLNRMHLQISQIINDIVSSGLLAEKIFLGGFSQGAAMALYSSLRQARTLAGCIALSGYLPAAGTLDHDTTPGGRGTPIFMAHGAFDSVVNPVLAQKSADMIDAYAETLIWREYNMDHELCGEELTHIAQFMNTALQN